MRRTALGGVLLIVAGAGAAQAMPQLAGIPAQVSHAPVITTPSANSTIVALKQNRTLINWSSFDISKGQQVDFLFQSNSGIVLNRVSGPAMIDGKLLGCVITCGAGGSIGGNVWIYSPSGVIFGSNAQVNVGGLLATTSPLLSTQDFLSGGQLGFKFGGGSADGQVLVQSGAQIYTRGSLALIAPSVVTETGALINAGGTALYGAAENYVIHFNDTANGLNLLDFEVPASALADGTVSATPLTISGQTNAGKVIVASVSKPSVMNAMISLGGMTTAAAASDGGGGDIILSAAGAPVSVAVTGQLQASHGVSLQAPDGGAITVSGSVTAAGANGAGGSIQLGGAGTGAVDLAAGAQLNASASAPGQVGGQVVATANAVQVDGAINATGPAGGGAILVGGGAQGKDAAVADAATTHIGAGAMLDASATASGAGGQVVVWSNQATSFQGTIASRGGPSGGAGGSAEVSSAGYLSYAGSADLRAADGTAGQLLLDPSELIIIPSGGADTLSGGANAAAGASSTLGVDVIDTALLSADVTISTHMATTGGDGVIEFNGGSGPLAFNNTGTVLRTLTFNAETGFLFDTSVATKGHMNLTLNADASPITLPMGAYVAVTDGELTLMGSNLSLQGDLGAGTVDLVASGTINQSGGVITTSNLTGSSGGSTSLTGANAVSGVQMFNAGGDFTLNTEIYATLNNVTAAGAANVQSIQGTLFVASASGGTSVSLGAGEDIYIYGPVSGPSTTLTAAGTINQYGGVITANALTATANRGISLNDANAVTSIGGLSNAGFGGIAFTAAGDLSVAGDVSAAAQNVSLVSNSGAINQTSGAITAGNFSAAAANGLSLTGSNTIASVSGLTSTAGNVAFADTVGFTLDGDLFAPGQTASLVSSGGAITQTSGSITADTFSASAVSGLILDGNNQIGHVTALSNSGSGGLTFNDNQSVTIDSVTLGGGDISLSASSGDLTLTSAVTSPGALTLVAGGNLTGTALTSAGDLTLTSGDTFAGAISFNSVTVGGDATFSATTMSPNVLQPSFPTGSTGNLSLTFTGTLGSPNLSTNLSDTALVAPGSVSVTTTTGPLTVGSIQAGANVTLSSARTLFQGEGGVIAAASLTASAVNGLELDGPNLVASVTALTNTASGSLFFNDDESVMIGSVNQGGSGAIGLTTYGGDLTLTSAITSASSVNISASAGGSMSSGNLTVDGVTAAGDVTLYSTGALSEVAGAAITTGGSYMATAMAMNPAAEQPVFTATSGGNLNLTFTQSGLLANLTGVPLSAPGSVTVQANNESLTVDSISAGSGEVTLYSGGSGSVLTAASGAKINLLNTDYDTYSVTAVSLNLSNPSIVQPVFSAPNYGYLTLTLTQPSVTPVNLTGAPLSAPGSVTVNVNNTSLILDAITAGASGVNVTSGSDLQVASITTPGSITLNSGGVLSASSGATINVGGNYTATTQTVDLTNPMVVAPTFMSGSTGSVSLTFTQSNGTIDLSSVALSAPGSVSVSLSSNDTTENLTVGPVTAIGGDVTLYTGAYYSTGGALTIGSINAAGDVNLNTNYYYNSGGPITATGLISAGGSVTATSDDNPTGGAFTFGAITAGGSVNLNTANYYYSPTGAPITTGVIQAGGAVTMSTGQYGGGALTVGLITAGSDVNLSAGTNSSGVLTVDSITSTGGGVTLDAGGALMAAAPMGVSVSTGGSYSATGTTIDPQLYQPSFTGTSGDLSLTFTGGNAVDLTLHPLSAPGGSVSVSNNSDLTVDSITALNDITLSSSGNLMAASGATMTLGGDYGATGGTIDSVLFQPTFTSGSTGSLSLTFTAGEGFIDLSGHPLTAPGSISITATNSNLAVDSLTAGGDITLFSSAELEQGDVSPFAITLGGSYSATANFIQSALTQPVFTFGSVGNLSLHYTGTNGGASIDLTGVPLTAPGSVSVTADVLSLTVDSITAGGDVSLTANQGTVFLAPMAAINLGGSYNLSELTIDPSALHPIFAGGTFGDFNLTIYGSGGADLTGSPLSAPGSVSVYAPSENLNVDSITAGDGVSLYSGVALTNASGAVITLGGDYSATGVTISTGLLQPTYTTGSTGSLSLTFNQSGSSIDLTGTPLTAPGSITIQLNGSNENLTVDTLTATAGDVTISSNYYNSGALTASVVNAGGSVNLSTGSYYGGALMAGAIDAGGSVNLSTGYYGGAPLTVGPITAGSSVNMSAGVYSSGTLTVSSISAGGGVSLTAGGALSAASTVNAASINFTAYNGPLTVGVLTAAGNVALYDYSGNIVGASATGVTLGGSYSATASTIDTRLYQPTFTAGSSGSLSLTFRETGGAIDLTGFPLTAPGSITLNSSEDLTVDSLTAGAGSQVQLSASGALTEVGGAVITAQDLYAIANNGIVLNGPNAVQSITGLNNYDTGGISFTNQGDLHIDGAISANSQTVNLVSNTGEIVEDNCGYYCASVIFADTLTASAITGINLNGNYYYYSTNQINNIGHVANTTSGGINILNYSGLTLVGDISAPGQTVSIVSEYGALNQTGGAITAAMFTATATNGITLNEANAVSTLGALSNSSSGGISFTDAGDLLLNGAVTADFHTVNLVSNTGAVTEAAGVLTESDGGAVFAETLTGSAATGFHLDQSNVVARVGDLANTGLGGISFTNTGDVLLTGNISAPGQFVSLTSQTGAIRQSTGVVTAGTLDLTAVTGVDLSGPNAVSQLGAVTTTSGNVNFVNAISFTLIDDVNLTGQSLSLASNGGSISQSGGAINADSLTASAATGLSLTGSNVVANLGLLQNGATGGIAYTSAGALTLSNDINGFAQSVTLTSQTGALTQAPGEVITAGFLQLSAANGISLTNANAITDLFTVSNSGAGGVTLNDADSLTVLGNIQAAGQAVNLTGASAVAQLFGAVTANTLTVNAVDGIILTNVSASLGPLINTTDGGIGVSSTGDLQLASNVAAPGQGVALNAQGSIVENGGAITAGTLFLSANTGVNLGGANQVAVLSDSFNTTSGFTLNNVGDLALKGYVIAPGQTLSLTTTGALNQPSGAIEASTLVVSAQNGISLTDDNLVANLGSLVNTTSGDISFTNAGDFTLMGDVTANLQTVNLVSNTGAITQSAGAIMADTLTASAVNGISLNDVQSIFSASGDAINLGKVINTTSGGISISGSALVLTDDLTALGQTVNLSAPNGFISQSAGVIAAGTLNASAGSSLIFLDANQVAQLGVLEGAFGVVRFTNVGDLVLTGDVSAQADVQLVSTTGALSQTGGVITTSYLIASSVTGLSLTNANQVERVFQLTNSTSGGINFTNAGDIILPDKMLSELDGLKEGDISAPGQTVSLTSQTGGLYQTEGVITAGTLNVTAVTGIALNDPNLVANLGQLVNSGSGGIAFANVGDIVLSVNLAASGQVVSLTSTTGAITQSGGETITADTLNASAATGVTLTDANTVTNLGVLNNTASGGISFVDAGDPFLTGNITAPGQNVSLVSETGALIQTEGVITAGTLSASATNGIALTDANAIGALGAVANTGSGGITFTNVGGFDLTGAVVADGQFVTLTSTGGAITQTSGSINAVDAVLNAAGAVALTSVSASDQVTITGTGLTLTAGEGAAVTAPSVVIQSRSGLVDLGDGLVDPGFTGMAISNASFNAIQADAISIYAGYFAGPTNRLNDLGPQNAGAIKVGNLSRNTGGLSEPTGGASLSLFAGPGSTVEVLGSITPTTVGTGNLLIGDSVADTWTPKAILVSGGIGATGSTLDELNSVELNAVSSVVFGDANFITAVENAVNAGQSSSINITLGLPGGVSSSTGANAVFLSANSVTLRAQGAIVSQNTGSDAAEGGIVLPNDNKAATVLTLGTTAGATTTPTPVVVDLFGGVTDATGLVLTGKDIAPSTEVVLETPLVISDSYRFNSCTIGKMNVCVVKSLPVKLIEGVILTTDAPAPLPSYAVTPLITFKPLDPIGDPTITGIGNEEIWRGPSCDPNGATSCP
jgi:filamentous hemagglutinin family protein